MERLTHTITAGYENHPDYDRCVAVTVAGKRNGIPQRFVITAWEARHLMAQIGQVLDNIDNEENR